MTNNKEQTDSEGESKLLWAKIYCEEGVIFEKKYDTEAEAKAFVDGCKAYFEHCDPEQDFYSFGIDSVEALELYED